MELEIFCDYESALENDEKIIALEAEIANSKAMLRQLSSTEDQDIF